MNGIASHMLMVDANHAHVHRVMKGMIVMASSKTLRFTSGWRYGAKILSHFRAEPAAGCRLVCSKITPSSSI